MYGWIKSECTFLRKFDELDNKKVDFVDIILKMKRLAEELLSPSKVVEMFKEDAERIRTGYEENRISMRETK
jgi:hypothetical protein